MKKTLSTLSLLITVITLSSLQFSVSSCTKEVEVIVIDTLTDTLTVRDTIEVEKPPIDTLAVLTAKNYHMEEIYILQNDEFFYYNRGGVGNTAVFDQEYIKFNVDKTGSYYYFGETNTLTWDFVDGKKTKIRYTLNRSTPINITWENITYKGDSLRYAEYYVNGQLNSMSSVLRLAK